MLNHLDYTDKADEHEWMFAAVDGLLLTRCGWWLPSVFVYRKWEYVTCEKCSKNRRKKDRRKRK